MRYGIVALWVVSVGLWAPTAFGQSAADRESARALLNKGDAAYDKKDFAAALKAYEAADAIMHVPTTTLAVARAQAELGKLVEARDTALNVVRTKPSPNEPEAFARARTEADELAKLLAPRIPELIVNVEGAQGATVTIDGVALPAQLLGVPRKLNPGKHVIVAKAAGFRDAQAEVELAERASEKVSLELEPEAAASATTPLAGPSSEADQPSAGGTSPLVYIGFGLGAVGIGVGSVTGVMSLSKASSAKDQCDGNVCPASAKDDADSSKSLANISNIGFGVGLVGIGVGIYGLLSSKSTSSEKPPSARAPRVQPLLGARFVGVHGSF